MEHTTAGTRSGSSLITRMWLLFRLRVSLFTGWGKPPQWSHAIRIGTGAVWLPFGLIFLALGIPSVLAHPAAGRSGFTFIAQVVTNALLVVLVLGLICATVASSVRLRRARSAVLRVFSGQCVDVLDPADSWPGRILFRRLASDPDRGGMLARFVSVQEPSGRWYVIPRACRTAAVSFGPPVELAVVPGTDWVVRVGDFDGHDTMRAIDAAQPGEDYTVPPAHRRTIRRAAKRVAAGWGMSRRQSSIEGGGRLLPGLALPVAFGLAFNGMITHWGTLDPDGKILFLAMATFVLPFALFCVISGLSFLGRAASSLVGNPVRSVDGQIGHIWPKMRGPLVTGGEVVLFQLYAVGMPPLFLSVAGRRREEVPPPGTLVRVTLRHRTGYVVSIQRTEQVVFRSRI